MDEIREVIEDGKVRFKMRVSTKMEEYRWRTALDKEPETISWLKSFDPHDVFLDIGANVGVYSLYAASLFPDMSIFSLEPSKYNYEILVQNKAINGFFRINAWHMGVGINMSAAKFRDADNAPGATGGHFNPIGYTVPISDIRSIIKWHAQSHWWNIKIDTDGDEFNIIHGIKDTWAQIKSALVEVNDSSEEIIDLFRKNGLTTNNKFNTMSPHSTERRIREGIKARNIIFTREQEIA